MSNAIIKRLSIDELRKRNISNLEYIKKIAKTRLRKHRRANSWSADKVSWTGFGMDSNSQQKAYEYGCHLNDIRKVLAEKGA